MHNCSIQPEQREIINECVSTMLGRRWSVAWAVRPGLLLPAPRKGGTHVGRPRRSWSRPQPGPPSPPGSWVASWMLRGPYQGGVKSTLREALGVCGAPWEAELQLGRRLQPPAPLPPPQAEGSGRVVCSTQRQRDPRTGPEGLPPAWRLWAQEGAGKRGREAARSSRLVSSRPFSTWARDRDVNTWTLRTLEF